MRYNSYTDDQRQRVLSTAREGGNWAQVALHNGIAYQTAWRWVNRARTTNVWTPSVGQRGGPRRVKITPEHVEYMVTLLEDKCLLTLYDLVDELKVKYDIDVVPSTVYNALDAICFTCKKIHSPSEMNSSRVKELRRQYVKDIMLEQAKRKRILYFDETNFNLFCTRNFGWSRRGSRAVVVRPGSRGENLSIIACISACGLEHVKYRWGTNDAESIEIFVRELLDSLMDQGISLFNVVVVCDNASIHAGVKEVTQLSDYVGVELIKLSPYSPMLNPIENVFSVFKSGVKSYLAEHRDAILRPPRGVTKAEHRASYMIRAAKHSMSTKVTSELCDSKAAHTLSFHARALDLEDMPVGS
ncbi:hypothetical protein AM588_10000386 [Phytophthora nicotianae]|uniref:Tc1-like transposase DDE domain-containing protein n=1 Tax=Phytophthora nicotianae TaxID=4792 RepID=A0A0W8CEI2_PHYNI|nr:hypothetical protein AM588_10000386 [Phytophthora nicotianae]